MHPRRLLIGLAAFLALATPARAAAPGWSPTGAMTQSRGYASAVLLDNGKVLVAGGDGLNATLASAELYDPATGQWSPAGSMTEPRTSFSLAKLPNGKVVAAGGYNAQGPRGTAEFYDPATNSWTAINSMSVWRNRAAVAPLPDGSILLAGGGSQNGQDGASESVASDGRWTARGAFANPRSDAGAAPLRDGTVLMAGGYDGGLNPLASATRFSGSWSTVASMSTTRVQFDLVTLNSGKVLAAGGTGERSAEVYDPATNIWTATAPPASGHSLSTSTRLANGKVLLAGGLNNPPTELYDPASNAWTAGAPLATAHVRHTATLLPDGRVLVAGGYTAAAELWTPSTQLSADPGLAFGDHAAATTATLNITNTGDSSLFADGFAVGGANPTDFTVDGSRCRGPVAPNATCTVDVQFAPTADGARSATLTFTANTAATTHALPLTGRGFTPTVDTDGDGVTAGDRCPTLKGPAARQGCPTGLLADPSIRYRPSGKGIRVIAYYVKATTGARVTVTCSKGCKRTSTKGKGAKRVRITRLNHKRLANGAKITITVSKPGRLTTTVTDRISRGRRIEGRPRCTPVGC